MSENKNFLGMPVEGDIYSGYDKPVEQYSEEEVDALFAGVIGLRGVEGISWTQYTPYFNDGSPCVFGVGDLYFALSGVEADENENKGWFDYGWMEDDFEENGRVWLNDWDERFKKIVGDRKVTWEGTYPNNKAIEEHFPVNPGLYYPIRALVSAVGSGKCDHVLLGKFGDHSRVIIDVKAGRVTVDEYDHD